MWRSQLVATPRSCSRMTVCSTLKVQRVKDSVGMKMMTHQAASEDVVSMEEYKHAMLELEGLKISKETPIEENDTEKHDGAQCEEEILSEDIQKETVSDISKDLEREEENEVEDECPDLVDLSASNKEQVAPAVLPLANQESSPPSLVPVEVADVERPRERLYPELPRTCQSVKHFTSEQLRTWEPGSWLENVAILEAEFQSLAHQEGHELYELLLSYWRCRKQLTQAQTELQAANSDCKNVQNRLWSFKDERLSLQGVCADQTKVYGYHCYQEVTLNEAALAELKHLFSAKAEILHQTVALHSYTSILSRLQVESYLYRLLSSNPTTKSSRLYMKHKQLSQPSSLQPLKESISVLFIFTRRVLDDSQFQADIHLWLQRLASVLHQVGSTGDHLFILNHLLCCPAGVGKWAVPFLQIKVLDNPSGVYHFMQALAILMSPARHRADFLGHMTPSDAKGNSLPGLASGNWTLVDEGGEEDEDPETSWMLLSEDDLVSLFSQFPFDELFKHLLGICSEGDYQPQATSSQKMMKIFAFASSLVELLAVGLQTYNRARYRQFVKRIGYMIRMTLCYVSDHWAQYISLRGVSRTTMQEQSFSMEKLQVEFDHLFLRAVLYVLKAKRLGIWLFMSEMPYGTLSSSMLWKIFYIMQCAEMDGLEKLSCSLSAEDCIQGLREPSHQEKFQHWLSEINSSDGICLLTTFAHMAQPRRTDVDPEFVRNIVLEIYEVAYVSITTREIFSKVGRELLAAIATAHPHIITVLLERLRETIEKVGMVSLYLFKELPVYLWTPAQAEVGLIRDWLLNFSLTAVENRLACIILEGLNWGFQPNGCLILPASLHSEVALLVIESYQKYLTDKPYGGIFSEGIKQVSYLANVVRLGQTPESSFNQWAWDLVLRLKLHANEISPQDAWCPLPSSSAPGVPEITDSPSMHPVFKAVKAGIPIGCFLAIDMTTIGHSLEQFCSDGISLLKTLVQSRHLKAVVHTLENILPLVYHCQFYLLKNEQFLSCMQLFLQLDSGTQGVTQQVTQKVAQHLIGTSTCENIKLLNSVIQAHILESSRPGRVGAVAVLEFWLQVLTEQNLWHRDKAVLYLLDHLCRAAFLHQQEECLQKLLYQQHKSALGYHGERGLLSSLMGWIVAGNVTPSFIEGNSLTGEVWFAWLVLNMETMFEEDSQLRRCVEHELLSNPAYTPDQALKKAQVRLKLQVVPSLQRLMIYRWTQQALATPADHPLLPLFWQKFFQLYLRQPGPEFGLEVKGCIGRRYFHGAAHLSLLKSLRQRLVEVSDFHHAASKALKVPCSSSESSDGLLTPETPITQYMTSPELHTELVRLFTVFALWLDDENLQKQEIYLPSLPKEYDTHRLAKIMQRQQEVWMEHVDIERVQHELQEVLSLWSKVKNEPALSQNINFSIFTDFINPLAARERILTHLRKHDAAQGALLLVPVKAPVPDILTESLADEKISTALIQEDLAKLQHQAKLATVRETQQVVLDNELLEVLPQLYINREDQLSMQLECRGKGGQPCQGPAHITVKYSRMHKLDPVQNQIQCLKSDIKQLQADGIKAPPQCLAEAAVHTENFITALVNAYKLNPSPGILKVGLTVFYQIVSFVCEDTQRHPPTRQFFTSCIEILGQVFIRDVRSECKQMLKTILLNRHLCNLLSPYFTPNASPAELVSLYEEVVNTLHIDSGDVIFMLLTKFDLTQWLSVTQPQFSERSRLMAIIHQALCTCGLEPEPEVLMPFNIFCKHWTELLLYQFPDHYSDFLRLLMQSSSEQLLSPECWRTSLIVLGCSPHPKIKTNKTRSILLSPQQVDETIEWLSKYFLKLRLSNGDFRSFGLLSKWGPYIEEIKMFWEDLITYVIDLELNNCSKEPVGSPRLVKGTNMYLCYKTVILNCNSILQYYCFTHKRLLTDSKLLYLYSNYLYKAFLHLTVQFLTSLDQNGNISLASLETEMEKLLEYIVIFNPPETDLQQRHMATCSLFAEMLTLLNEAGISTAEGLGTKLHSWVEKRARGALVLPLLTAACRCLASVRHMTRTTEACILSYFTDGECADQYSGWGPILVSLQVPELTVEDFIQESLNLGSYLTLYVYILQRLNLEQTLLNEKKTLVQLNTWISQVFPSGPADEAKLFLWWHKFLELVQIQVDQEDTCALDTLILALMAFQNRLAQLGEERLNSGILGAIGLGRKSPLSSSFRVVARSMSTFLLVQVPSENQLRLHPGTELQLPAKAQQALSVLEQMPSNKQYSELHVSVNQAIQFIKYPSHCLCDSNRLLTLLVNALYTDLHYLDIIR
uniref:Ectopic P granules protein 5 homolog n=1 Tax=Sinocyclocheilus grahami TaxID=75366 RepID=A0A672N741_SINGR